MSDVATEYANIPPRINKPTDVLSVLTHTTAAAALTVAAYKVGTPLTMLAGGALVGTMTYKSIIAANDYFMNEMVEHPDAHEFSPNLRPMVDELYARSGLKVDNNPVYRFRPKDRDDAAEDAPTGFRKMLRELFERASATPNAAASHFAHPVIMISEPLLKALDDSEEYAVLAHEFGHAIANHQKSSLPQRVMTGTVKASNTLVLLTQIIQTGLVGMASAIYAGVIASNSVKLMHSDGYLASQDDDNLSIPEIFQKNRVKKQATLATQGAVTAIVSAFNPLYAAYYVGARGMAIGSNYLNQSLSRQNEYQADRAAVDLGANPLSLITALRKLEAIGERSKRKAWGDEPLPESSKLQKAWKKAFATHPVTKDRISELALMAENQGIHPDLIEDAVNGPIDISHADNIPIEHIRFSISRFSGADPLLGDVDEQDMMSYLA